jgi:hypothetical protein
MTAFPNSPRLLKGGIVIVDHETSAIKRIIALQYNPETLTRTLQTKTTGGGGNDRSEPLRVSGPPVETLKLEASIDATDQLEIADSVATKVGILPHLAALEMLIYPTTDQLKNLKSLSMAGTLEIAPMEGPLTLFIWSKNRIMPVRITEFSITEEAFDTNLNPIIAKVNLGMRVLSVDDFGFSHKGGNLYMNYQQHKEQLASIFKSSSLSKLGIENIP